jgi:hypothetical protein
MAAGEGREQRDHEEHDHPSDQEQIRHRDHDEPEVQVSGG